ncbi:hypothetical protein HHI36_022006, partial [Cryptolaemus montrouzieri]
MARRPLTETELEWYAQHIWDNHQDSNDGLDDDRSDLDYEEELGPNNQDIHNAVIEFEDGVWVVCEQVQNDQDHFSEDEADIQDPSERNNSNHTNNEDRMKKRSFGKKNL